MDKIYEKHHFDDYISSDFGIQPTLIASDLFSRIIDNESFDTLKKRTKDLMNFGYTVRDETFIERRVPYSTPDFRFSDFSTPLLLACFCYKSYDYIEYLVVNINANVNYIRDISLYKFNINVLFEPINSPFKHSKEISPLMTIIISDSPCKTHVVKLLISYSADVNFTNCVGDTPLIYAAWCGNIDIINTLISNGANINQCNIHSTTPLCSAFFGDKFLHAKTIIKNHPNLNMFLKKYNTIRDILEIPSDEITDDKIEIFSYVRKYIKDRAYFCYRIFPSGIGDPLYTYMIST